MGGVGYGEPGNCLPPNSRSYIWTVKPLRPPLLTVNCLANSKWLRPLATSKGAGWAKSLDIESPQLENWGGVDFLRPLAAV